MCGLCFGRRGREDEWLFLLFTFLYLFSVTLLPVFVEFDGNAVGAHVVGSDGCQQVFKRFQVVLLTEPLLGILASRLQVTWPQHAQFAVQTLTSNLDVDVTLVSLELAANLALGVGGTSN